MTDVWITIGVLAVGTVMIKAAGPLAVGGRALSPPATRVISLLAPAVLAALVVVGTFSGPDSELTLDARALGLGRGGAGDRAASPAARWWWSRRRPRPRRRGRWGWPRPAALASYGSRPVRAIRANTRALGRSVRRSVSGSYEKKPKRG